MTWTYAQSVGMVQTVWDAEKLFSPLHAKLELPDDNKYLDKYLDKYQYEGCCEGIVIGKYISFKLFSPAREVLESN